MSEGPSLSAGKGLPWELADPSYLLGCLSVLITVFYLTALFFRFEHSVRLTISLSKLLVESRKRLGLPNSCLMYRYMCGSWPGGMHFLSGHLCNISSQCYFIIKQTLKDIFYKAVPVNDNIVSRAMLA